MNTTQTRSTIPTADRVHADRVACQAARRARIEAGADVAQSAQVYATVYAQAMRGER